MAWLDGEPDDLPKDWTPRTEPEPMASARVILDAFVAVGLADPDEAKQWLTEGPRWHPEPPEPTPAMREAVAREVERLLASGHFASPDPWEEHGAIARLTATLASLGLFDRELAEQWLAPLRSKGVEVNRALGRLPHFTGQQPLGVVVGPPVRRRGTRITAVELYTDGVIVHWHRAQLGRLPDGTWPQLLDEVYEPDPSWIFAPRLTLHDDLGTRYHLVSGNGGGGAVEGRPGFEASPGNTFFVPRVPDRAGALWVAQGADRFDVLGGR